MHTRRLAGCLSVFLAVTAVPVVGQAREPKAARVESATARAKQHFKKGRALQRTGGYDQAIAEYEWAYKLAPRPELLFNIAQCHRLGGRSEEAIDYYLRFLEDAPSGDPAAKEARGHVIALRKRERDRVVPEREPASLRVATPAPVEEPDVDLTPAVPKSAPVTVVAAPTTSPSVTDLHTEATSEGARPMKWVGVGSMVSGAALIGMGAYYGVRAAQTADELDDATGTWTPEQAAREASARGDETRLYYLAGGGGALVVLGAALWWWDREHHAPSPAGRERGLRAGPSLTPGAAGLVVEGAF